MMPTETIHLEQFRMHRLQIFNWGTFSNLHDIAISERGFLFTGPSGAGKSTLLDAFTALLIPPKWVDFNAAAREVEQSRRGQDRSLITYVRGAWGDQRDDETGDIVTQYLRPDTTWSALALTYQNALGQSISLVQLYWVRGSTRNNSDVKRYYLIFERPVTLSEFESFPAFDFEVRKLKQIFPEAAFSEDFSSYRERFSRLLQIENDLALRLLQKTQSAKNLGELNPFLREFMLETPITFQTAERLVTEFEELNTAYQCVVTARKQVETLLPAQNNFDNLKATGEIRKRLEGLRACIDDYRDIQEKALLQRHLENLRIQKEALEGEISHKEAAIDNLRLQQEALELQHREQGGGQIEQWESQKQTLEEQRKSRADKFNQMKKACEELGWVPPDAPLSFATMEGNAHDEVAHWQQNREQMEQQKLQLWQEKTATEHTFQEIRKEVEALQRQSSNIPAKMLALRDRIIQALGMEEVELPFVGELIEVKPEERRWQGAIERLLHPLALSLLVDEKNYPQLARYINDTHLKGRLVYYRTVKPTHSRPRYAEDIDNILFQKLNLKQNLHTEWLENELASRYAYSCVESIQMLQRVDRGVTITGQIRHNQFRHEKDDRHDVTDRQYWVLGFSNQEKRVLFEEQAQQLADTINKIEQDIKKLESHQKEELKRFQACQRLINITWQEVDYKSIDEQILTIENCLKQTRDERSQLKEIGQRLSVKKQEIQEANKALIDIKVLYRQKEDAIKKCLQDLDILERASSLSPQQHQALEKRFHELQEAITLENLHNRSVQVERQIGTEIGELTNECHQLEKGIEKCFDSFKQQWPMEAGDLDATLASVPDYLAKLERLKADRLPEYEARFFELLNKQSRENLAALNFLINQERKAILERMEDVNASLRQAPYNPGTYLKIEVSDKQLSEVREFRQETQQVLKELLADQSEIEMAETRFLSLRNLVERLSSQEPEKRRWRQSVLDVRLHVEFIARELDDDGKEVQVYRSGAGKSGGQRQKLTTTCLAAALRYQLGGKDASYPIYAPVIMDEAFDKADSEFTTMAMNIFKTFGFQMIVATPMKSVTTLEPFIGGACYIDIRERRDSSAAAFKYDEIKQRIDWTEHFPHEETIVTVS